MSLNITSTSDNKLIAPKRQFYRFPFRLPHEHGVVVTLILSTVLSIKLGLSIGLALFVLLGPIWLIFLLLHQERAALWFALVCAPMVGLFFQSLILAVLMLSFSAGKGLLSILSTHLGTSWRETFGMLAVAATPLLAVLIVTGNSTHAQFVTLAYTAASVLAIALTHILRRDPLQGQGPALVLATILWLCLWAQDPFVFAWCLVPFAVQLLALTQKHKPSFAQLGAIESISMLFVSVFLWLQIS